jgi:large subunit ribosomal protein L31
MKKDIHPKIYPAIFVDLSTGAEFLSYTTRKTQETKKIGNTEYNIVKVEITSDSHPFFTGKQKIIDTAGRVDKFRERMKKMQEMQEKKAKKVEVVEDAEAAAEATVEKSPKNKAAAKKTTAKKTSAKKK